MFELYQSSTDFGYASKGAKRLVQEGRDSFARYGLAAQRILDHGRETIIFPWRGDRVLNTLSVMLLAEGLQVCQDGVAVTVSDASVAEV